MAEPQYAVDVRNYLNKLREDLKTGGSEGVISQLREVTATLRPTLARLDAPTRTVLQIASLLPHDGLALPWVRAIAGQSHPELAADAATGESDPWTQLIRGLIGMRLFQPTPEPRVVAIHRILRHVLISDLLEGRDVRQHELVSHVQARSRALSEHWTDPACRWEIAPMDSFLQDFPRAELRAAGDIAYNLGLVQIELGDIGTAERSVLAAQRIDSATLPEDHPSRGATLNTLGRILWARGQVEEAESCLRKAIDLARNGNEEAKAGLAFRLNNLAQMLKESGKLTEAEPLFREALALLETSEGKEGRHVAECLHNLSALACAAGRNDEAETLLRRAVDIEESILPANHPNRALRLAASSGFAKLRGNGSEARLLFAKSLDIAEHCFGEKSSNLLPFLFNCIATTNDAATGRKLRLRVLELSPFGSQYKFEDILGVWLGNLHALLESGSEATASQSAIRTALDATRCFSEESVPVFLHSRACLALNLFDWGRPSDAIAVLDETRREVRLSGYKFTLDYANSLAAIAGRFRNVDRDSEAADVFREVLAIQETLWGESDPRLASILNSLGASLDDSHSYAEAAMMLERAVPLMAALVGTASMDYATVTHNYMNTLLRLSFRGFMIELIGSWYLERAEAMAIETYVTAELHRERSGDDHPYRQVALDQFRRIQASLGRDPEAGMSRLTEALAARRART